MVLLIIYGIGYALAMLVFRKHIISAYPGANKFDIVTGALILAVFWPVFSIIASVDLCAREAFKS